MSNGIVKEGRGGEEKPPIRTEGAMAPLFHAIDEKRKTALHFSVNEWALKVELMELSKKTSFEQFTRLISLGVECVGRSTEPESMYKMFNNLIDRGATAEQIALVEGFTKRIIPSLEHEYEEIRGVGEGGDSKFLFSYHPEWALEAAADAAKRLPLDRFVASLELGAKVSEKGMKVEGVLAPLSLSSARCSNAEFSKLLSVGNELADNGVDPTAAICTLCAIQGKHGEKKFFEMSELLRETMLELKRRGVGGEKVASIPEVADNWRLGMFKNNLEFMRERAREIGEDRVTIKQVKEISRLIGDMGGEGHRLWLSRLVELGDEAYNVAPYLQFVTKFVKNEEDWKAFELAFKLDLSKYRKPDLDSVFMKLLTDPEKETVERIKNAVSYLEERMRERVEKYGINASYFEPDDTMAVDLLVRTGAMNDKHVRRVVDVLSKEERVPSDSYIDLAVDAKGVKELGEPGMKFYVDYDAREYGVPFAGRIKVQLSRSVCDVCKGEVSEDEFAGKGVRKAAVAALDPAILNFKLIDEDNWVGNMDGVICKDKAGGNVFLLSSINFRKEHRVSKLNGEGTGRFTAKFLGKTIEYFGMGGYDYILIPVDVSERSNISDSLDRILGAVSDVEEREVRKAGGLKHLKEVEGAKESFRQLGEIREGEWVRLTCYLVKLNKEKYEEINNVMDVFRGMGEGKRVEIYDAFKDEMDAALRDKKEPLKSEIKDAILIGSVVLPSKPPFVFMFYDGVFDEFRRIVNGSVDSQSARRVVVEYLRDLRDSCESDYKAIIKNSNEAVERLIGMGIVKTEAGYEVDHRTLAHELARIFGSAYGGGHATAMPEDKSFVPDQAVKALYPFLPDFVTAAFSKDRTLLQDKEVVELVTLIRDAYLKQAYFLEEVKKHAEECIDTNVMLTTSMFYSVIEDKIREDEGFRKRFSEIVERS